MEEEDIYHRGYRAVVDERVEEYFSASFTAPADSESAVTALIHCSEVDVSPEEMDSPTESNFEIAHEIQNGGIQENIDQPSCSSEDEVLWKGRMRNDAGHRLKADNIPRKGDRSSDEIRDLIDPRSRLKSVNHRSTQQQKAFVEREPSFVYPLWMYHYPYNSPGAFTGQLYAPQRSPGLPQSNSAPLFDPSMPYKSDHAERGVLLEQYPTAKNTKRATKPSRRKTATFTLSPVEQLPGPVKPPSSRSKMPVLSIRHNNNEEATGSRRRNTETGSCIKASRSKAVGDDTEGGVCLPGEGPHGYIESLCGDQKYSEKGYSMYTQSMPRRCSKIAVPVAPEPQVQSKCQAHRVSQNNTHAEHMLDPAAVPWVGGPRVSKRAKNDEPAPEPIQTAVEDAQMAIPTRWSEDEMKSENPSSPNPHMKNYEQGGRSAGKSQGAFVYDRNESPESHEALIGVMAYGTPKQPVEAPAAMLLPGGDSKFEVPVDIIFSVPIHGTGSHAPAISKFSSLSDQHWPERSAASPTGSITVKKATSAKRYKKRDGSHSIELFCNDGPCVAEKGNKYPIQWLNMHRHHPNLVEFENFCLNAPGITTDARYVVLWLFKKLQDLFRKQLFDGYQIEPGTVIRCDGSSSRNYDNSRLSATFVCFPYLSVGRPHSSTAASHQDYPTRSMLQMLYPYESTINREAAPSFCGNDSKASENILHVPHCWVVMIGSEYIVTCSETGYEQLLGSSVTEVRYLENVPNFTEQWLPHLQRRHNVSQATPGTQPGSGKTARSPQRCLDWERRDSNSGGRKTCEEAPIQLFDGFHVEDFLMDEDRTWDSDSSIKSSIIPENVSNKHPAKPCADVHKKRPSLPLDGNASTSRAHEEDSYMDNRPPLMESGHSTRNIHADAASKSIPDGSKTHADQATGALDWAAEQEASVLSMLKALDHPEMATQYLTRFLTCISYVLRLWEQAPERESRRQHEILLRLERSIQRAEVLRCMCDLESQDETFSRDLGYRDVLLKALEVENTSWGQILQSLGDAVLDARTLFSSHTDAYTNAAIQNARNRLHHRRHEESRRENVVENQDCLEDSNTHKFPAPFLTWTGPSPILDYTASRKRKAAERLFAVMKDVETSLERRNELCYKHSTESTLLELDAAMVAIRAVSPRVSGVNTSAISQNPTERPALQVLTTEPHSPLKLSIGESFAQNAVLHSQQNALLTTTTDLFRSAKHFVGLYVPSECPHPVCKKIWGSLSRIAKSVTVTFESHEQSRHSYVVRPLSPEFINQHKIDSPHIPLQECTLCRQGYVYATVKEAVSHLKTDHFQYEGHLLQLAGLQATYRYFVRTETDLRNEFAKQQQLRTLRTCLGYLDTLVARAEKLNTEILQDEVSEGSSFQLGDGFIDCFEATALLVMQAATSILAIEEEVRRWEYVPGKRIEDIKVPIFEYALEKLDELGQSARDSMIKAEKALILADPEKMNVSTGLAGPELLVTILLQNLHKRHLLDGVSMNANQLYQEYTSKLQYRINQFPRKRLLRDIRSLQEELSFVRLVNSWQQKAFENLRKALNPLSFQAPTSDRAEMFSSESECLGEGLIALRSKAIELEALENRTMYLREQLRQSVEILEEDHGKAILVFTTITTIFLPLSFVTSFFGMNTSDIRDMERTQIFFWAIAIPVTAAVVFSAVFLAYRGDKLYDAVSRALYCVREYYATGKAHNAPLGVRGPWWQRTPIIFWLRIFRRETPLKT